ncbi:two-component system chemotaxis family CheBCheR fusion protein [Profundibacterium mesophilum KAUST100406-0324]|uniref:histidine kinase n=1 Tax=Profundibacterium mesophilum KAUST100406-0324 TaxID=1037889 RepID=A0A921TE09_9RHOB|nr:two-component system chemotaxis family CheBCheR fusion protein [Profundibacterium mesophilum KAUST100406-0324]
MASGPACKGREKLGFALTKRRQDSEGGHHLAGRFGSPAAISDAKLGELIRDSAVDYAIVTIAEDGTVTSWNEGAERILGWTEAEITGRSSELFFTAEDNAQHRMAEEMREAAETGRATDERYHMRQDGTRFYAHGMMMPLRFADTHDDAENDPAPPGFLKIFRDQTQQHEAELRVRELETSVASVLRASGTIGLYRFDPVAGTVWADASCAQMFDLDPDTLQAGSSADTFFARIHPDDLDRVSEEQRRTSEIGGHLDVTFRVEHEDGEVRWINALSDLGGEGDTNGKAVEPRIRSGVMVDVTERRREERLRTAVLEVGDGLRELDDPVEMARLAAEVMGRTLDLSRAGHLDLDPDGDTLTISADWTSRGATSLVGQHKFSDFGSWIEGLHRGETVVIQDTHGDPYIPNPAPLAAISIRSLINIPLMENGKLKAVLFVNDDRPREWTESELDFMRAVFDRTYAAIERARAVEERELMTRELAHRMKNVLTIAQVVTGQSLRHAQTLDDGRTQVAARLSALGRAQDMLTGKGSSQADIRAVILACMMPHLTVPERLRLEGPPLKLDEQQVLGLSLAIHELATNAGKYGALSVLEGYVDIRWTLDDSHNFELIWREIGGPAPEATDVTGFGSTILNRVTGSYFGGRSALRLEPEGAVFFIEGRLDIAVGRDDKQADS